MRGRAAESERPSARSRGGGRGSEAVSGGNPVIMRIAGKYDVLKQIGRGAFGVALLVRPVKEGDESAPPVGFDEDVQLDGTEVVIKKIDCTMRSKDEIAEAMNEVAVLQSLANGNPFIIGYRPHSTMQAPSTSSSTLRRTVICPRSSPRRRRPRSGFARQRCWTGSCRSRQR